MDEATPMAGQGWLTTPNLQYHRCEVSEVTNFDNFGLVVENVHTVIVLTDTNLNKYSYTLLLLHKTHRLDVSSHETSPYYSSSGFTIHSPSDRVDSTI